MLTIAPPPWSTIATSAARVARSVVKKLRSSAHWKSASSRARNPSSRRRTAPTLLTRTSTRPCSSMARRIRLAGPSAPARSTATGSTRSIPSIASVVRAAARTCAPSAASAFATARPMPLLAPVTTATLSLSPRSITRTIFEHVASPRMKPETISDGPTRNVVILAEHEDVTITVSRFSTGERGPDLHVHHEHTDAFYVLDGELTFELGPQAEATSVGPGGFVAVPANVAHSFVNASSADARWLNFHAPDCGFADFLRTLRAGTPGQWDSFDMPADGGLAPSRATISLSGEGERLVTGERVVLLKSDLPELCV